MAANNGVDEYIAELKSRWGYRATWLPGTTVNPGDIGRLDKQKFVIETDLAALGVRFTVTHDQPHPEYQFVSRTVRVKAAATAEAKFGPIPTVTVRAEFHSAGGFLFDACDCTSRRVQRIDMLSKDVLRLAEKGRWNPDWLIATEVVTAGSLVTLISAAAGAFAEVEARADLAAASVPIASLRGALRIGAYKDLECKIVSRGPVTPMFRAHGLAGRRRHPRLDPRSTDSVVDSDEPLRLRQVSP